MKIKYHNINKNKKKMGNCASGKTADDKEEKFKKNIHGGSMNGKKRGYDATTQNNDDSYQPQRNSSKSNVNRANSSSSKMSPDSRGDPRRSTSPNKASNGQQNQNGNFHNHESYETYEEILNEFFDAVGNGDISRVEQLLNAYEDKKKRRYKSELLNAGMAKADGLTALSIAAGRKHRDLTQFLAGNFH